MTEPENTQADLMELLSDIIDSEYNKYVLEATTPEVKQKAVNNIKVFSSMIIDKYKFDTEMAQKEIQREFEREENEKRREAERIENERKHEIEKATLECEKARIAHDKEIEENRKAESVIRKYIDIAEIVFDVVGLVTGVALTNKTLKVNLESVMTDRDAHASARGILEHFRFKKK